MIKSVVRLAYESNIFAVSILNSGAEIREIVVAAEQWLQACVNSKSHSDISPLSRYHRYLWVQLYTVVKPVVSI